MDEKRKIEYLQKRIEGGRERERESLSKKGEYQGKDDAFDFSYGDFMQYEEILKKYGRDHIGDISGEEPEIKKLYKDVRSKNRKNVLNIQIDRTEGNQGVEGNYNVIINTKEILDPLDTIPKDEQKRYYRGWINGIFLIYKELK